MTIWIPDLEGVRGAVYVGIADRLAEDIAGGTLLPGTRLPTHRELAYRLGVTVTTVSRAYAEAERRGLITGEVGRGTFVADVAAPGAQFAHPAAIDDPGVIDLTFNRPAGERHGDVLAAALADLATGADLDGFVSYGPIIGAPSHRAAAVEWFARAGLRVAVDDVVVTSGAQHALMVAAASILRPGDLVLTECLTYPGFKPIAKMLNLRLQGLPMDGEGVLPDAFAAACIGQRAKAIYLVPTHQNPTTVTMSAERREAIAEVARQHDVMIMEDDVYGLLSDGRPPPIASIAPERTLFVIGTSKVLLPGLRIGYLAAPRRLMGRISETIRAISWMASPLPAEIVSRWIMDGTADKLAIAQRDETRRRQALLRSRLGPWVQKSDPQAMHVWLELPDNWRASEFTAAALAQRVGVTPVEAFAVDHGPAQQGVRLCLGGAPLDRFETAIATLAYLLTTAGAPSYAVV